MQAIWDRVTKDIHFQLQTHTRTQTWKKPLSIGQVRWIDIIHVNHKVQNYFLIRLRDKMRIGPNVVHHQKLNYHIDFAQGVAHFGDVSLLDTYCMSSNTYAAGAKKEPESVCIICLLSSRCCYQFLHFVHCDFRARIFMWFLELPSHVLFTPAVLCDPCFVWRQCSLCIHRICIAVFINTIIWRTKFTQFHHRLSARSGAVIF